MSKTEAGTMNRKLQLYSSCYFSGDFSNFHKEEALSDIKMDHLSTAV